MGFSPAVIGGKSAPSSERRHVDRHVQGPGKSTYRTCSHAAGPLLRPRKQRSSGFAEPRHSTSDAPINSNGRRYPAFGEQMASNTAASYTPTRDDFAAMLDE